MHHGSVQCLCSQPDVGVSGLIGCCLCGKCADGLIFFLGSSRADIRCCLASRSCDGSVELLVLQCLQYVCRQLLLVNGKTILFPGKHKGALFLVIAVNGTVFGFFIPFGRTAFRLLCSSFLQPVHAQCITFGRLSAVDFIQQRTHLFRRKIRHIMCIPVMGNCHAPGIFLQNCIPGLVLGHAGNGDSIHLDFLHHLCLGCLFRDIIRFSSSGTLELHGQ